ncbi:MAG: hypothetical protein SFY95_04250 [Planctomycetota bacterium]|nr:hypothetical protein [Planctomycetota bacterium]
MLTLRAPAKVNLALAVSPPEPAGPRTGWHRISSLFSAISLADTLTLSESPESSSTFDILWAPDAPRPSLIDWPLEKDLTVRAHALLERHAGRRLPVRARLEKRIPVGGGLGGGSSNAAAMLRGLNHLFSLNIPARELASLSGSLGSDVAFFLDHGPRARTMDAPPRPAIVEHFGDAIARVPSIAGEVRSMLLVFPPFGCATPAVYKAFDALPLARADHTPGFDERAGMVRALARECRAESLFNDLTPAAALVQPALTPLMSELRTMAPNVHMTGSGSTLMLFGAGTPDAAALERLGCAWCTVTLVG